VYRQPRSGFTRIPYVQACTLEVDGREREAMSCNLSLLGAYLHLEPPLEPGTRVSLRFPLPDGEGAVSAEAVVTWINPAPPASATALPAGCGVRFTGLSPADLRRLSALVASFQTEPRPQIARPEPEPEKVRIPFVAPCVVAGPGGPVRGSVCNLSANGVFVAVHPIPEEGAAVIVGFRLPGLDDLFERVAKVAWRNLDGPSRVRALPPGCGLRFANLSDSDRARLAALIHEYSGQLPGRSA
jgi:Tfp pilus assembly protein PilZ